MSDPDTVCDPRLSEIFAEAEQPAPAVESEDGFSAARRRSATRRRSAAIRGS